jgi:hypothetical protein
MTLQGDYKAVDRRVLAHYLLNKRSPRSTPSVSYGWYEF